MRKALVIADDLSGAAEIAGIGYRYGLPTRLVRERPKAFAPGLTVIDSDSRSLSLADAAKRVGECIAGIDPTGYDLIYKKTDSVFRGPIAAELGALMTALNRPAALLVPQNPTRARVIAGGIYTIDDVPLNATPFAADPEHPARSADVLELLGECPGRMTNCAPSGEDVADEGITVGCGSSTEDLRAWAVQAKPHVLPAGGAEFFQAMLERIGVGSVRQPIERLRDGATLFADGSASAYSAGLLDRARKENMPVTPMPNEVFAGPDDAPAALDEWLTVIADALSRAGRCLVTIGRAPQSHAGDPVHLQRTLAEAVARITERHVLANLLLAGGATASAICRQLGWSDFSVRGELASGVVQLEPQDPTAPHVIVKPGSYPWPDLVWWH
jgi:uncharacterized protein YgbK (DUF1537 family)